MENPSEYMFNNVKKELQEAFKKELIRYSSGDSVGFYHGFYNTSVLNMLKETVEEDAEPI